ncbi:MAG TPA: SufS family cysteine desulfurase, partial [Pirellulales bacterium]
MYDVEAIRRDFPILDQTLPNGAKLVYLDNGASTQTPRQVIDAIVACQTGYYANVHRGVHTLSERSTDAFELAREKVQRFINAASLQEVIFTSGTTMSINLVAQSWGGANVKAGDEIIVTELEHHANLTPWQQLCERTGAKLRHIPLTSDGRLDLDAFEALLSSKTKLVAVAAVSNVLGTIAPLDAIIAKAHAAGALVLVDAAQSVPHLPTDVQALKADFLAFSAHKMCGLSGVGVLYGRQELLEAMPPFMSGGNMIRRVERESFTCADLPAKFEPGTPAIAPVIALGAAIDYLTHWGLDAIHAHEMTLVKRAYEGLLAQPGVQIYGPDLAHRSGLVSFTLTNVRGKTIHSHDVADLLDKRGVAVRAGHHCTMPLHKQLGVAATSRASFY